MSDEERARKVAYQVGVDSWATYPGHGAAHVAAALAAVRAEERESIRAKCEAIAREYAEKYGYGPEAVDGAIDAIAALKDKP